MKCGAESSRLPKQIGTWLPGLAAAAAGGADVIEGDGAGAEEDEGKCEGGESQGEFVSSVARESIMEVHLGDGDGEIDADAKSSNAGEQAEQQEQSAEELSKGRDVGGPARESEAGDEVGVVMESAENLVVSMDKHDGAESEAHDEEREGLQAIEVAHEVPPTERKIDYSSGTWEGSGVGGGAVCPAAAKGRSSCARPDSRGRLSPHFKIGNGSIEPLP
jgi:hypothetical protein